MAGFTHHQRTHRLLIRLIRSATRRKDKLRAAFFVFRRPYLLRRSSENLFPRLQLLHLYFSTFGRRFTAKCHSSSPIMPRNPKSCRFKRSASSARKLSNSAGGGFGTLRHVIGTSEISCTISTGWQTFFGISAILRQKLVCPQRQNADATPLNSARVREYGFLPTKICPSV